MVNYTQWRLTIRDKASRLISESFDKLLFFQKFFSNNFFRRFSAYIEKLFSPGEIFKLIL